MAQRVVPTRHPAIQGGLFFVTDSNPWRDVKNAASTTFFVVFVFVLFLFCALFL
jgi:hypothetical protein